MRRQRLRAGNAYAGAGLTKSGLKSQDDRIGSRFLVNKGQRIFDKYLGVAPDAAN
ncbi:hypothetical protein [[Phormidium] sp. ETS-05]|uniref:hypothetical protein n=1 Tax=[Phormidium] sp. ETS-05 TaxID=222819 RepID=UPI0018EF17C7|nr:hypothetical protein [[Phormidium] sp. ETS-05]